MLVANETSPYQDLIAERLTDVRSVTIPAGHFTMIEKPVKTNNEIARFVSGLSV